MSDVDPDCPCGNDGMCENCFGLEQHYEDEYRQQQEDEYRRQQRRASEYE